ncbi:MAG: hypothetical protein U0229_24520 [Anaeromyxobacter sp.]
MLHGAHLVGSVPLGSSSEVFRTVSAALGPWLRTLPDGETGVRKDWIAWQYAVLAGTPGLEPVPPDDRVYLRKQLVRRVPGAPPPAFGALGYADAAIASFSVFDELQATGAIPRHLRFQVSLPTPLAPPTVFVALPDRAEVEAAYERALHAELVRILAHVPHDRLAIQWDVAAEFGLLEGLWPAHFVEVERGVLARLDRCAGWVPPSVALGFHLCYGDFGHRHFVEPPDASRLVRVANALARPGWRAPDWVHLPVPMGWATPESFAPLSDLALPAVTRLFLGVVHASDGLPGARHRIARARDFVHEFGIATECGWGRRPPATIPALLTLHRELLEGTRSPRA